MRKCFAMMAVVLLAGSASESLAKTNEILPAEAAPRVGDMKYDMPAAAVQAQGMQRFAPGDTISFGNDDGSGFAVEGGVWDFDTPPTLQGWYATDVTQQSTAYWRHVTDAIWNADPNNTVAAPVLNGTGSAWVGAFGSEANDLCWEAGLGYGNSWCQRLTSPEFTYDGSSNVIVSWNHFNDTEVDFDYSIVYLATFPSSDETLLKRYTGQIGLAGDHPASPPDGVADQDVLNSADFAGETRYRIIFEMTSDGGWSDSDALSPTEYGPAGFDDMSIDGDVSDFESGLDGWTASACPGFGTFIGINGINSYLIEDPCTCELAGNVLEMHDDNNEHPYGQRVAARSGIADLANGTDPNGIGNLSIFARWSQYSVLPQANGVFYRPGWDYFPFECLLTGAQGWSGRVGQNSWFFVGEDPACTENINSGTSTDVPVPPTAEQVRFVYEIYASCDAFSISEDVCTDITNFTPIIDNITIRTTKVPDAPPIAFDNGLRFQDGFAQNTPVNVPNEPGNADVTRNRNFGATPPIILGDSLYVSGPLAGSDPATQWEAKLWFNVERVGPSADSRYTDWRDAVADGNDIENGEWTFAFMDSFQVGTNTANNKFISYFREDDDDFDGGAGELTSDNEIIADGVLFPGTQVNYFVSSNFIGNPQSFLLPDTAGGFSLEFEILPNWRDDGGTLKYPCLLYIDAFNAGAQFFIENAFDVIGIEADRYDYLDASSNWKAPMARGSNSQANNGCTLPQLLGYRGILVNTGTSNITSLMWPLDYLLFSDWLTAEICEGITTQQGIIFNGNGIANSMKTNGAALLTQLGAVHLDDQYSDFAFDENECVRLEAPVSGGEEYGTSNSSGNYEYDAYGNWCPIQFSFDVLDVASGQGGVGNRVYLNVADLVTETEWAQVVKEDIDAGNNARTVIDGVSYHNLSEVDAVEECVGDSAHTVTAAFNEIQAALEWIYGVGNIPDLCEDPCQPGDVNDPRFDTISGVTKLYQSTPNPFNARTNIRFSLAQSGEAKVTIYDASGRLVRTLVDGELDAGTHSKIWDGTNDAGQALPAGVYWARVFDGVQTSSGKLVQLH